MPRKPKTNSAGNVHISQPKDRCQTPPYALKPLLGYLPTNCTVWEPATGEGYLAHALARHVSCVITSDLLDGPDHNFFNYHPALFDHPDPRKRIVTNPPFSIKYKWLARCYELGFPFALLMPGDVLFSSTAQKLFKKHGIEVLIPDKRIKFKMPNIGWENSRPQFLSAWFCYKFNIGTEITFVSITEDYDHYGRQFPLFPEESA